MPLIKFKDVDLLKQKFDEGLKPIQLTKVFGISRQWVYVLLRKHNLLTKKMREITWGNRSKHTCQCGKPKSAYAGLCRKCYMKARATKKQRTIATYKICACGRRKSSKVAKMCFRCRKKLWNKTRKYGKCEICGKKIWKHKSEKSPLRFCSRKCKWTKR